MPSATAGRGGAHSSARRPANGKRVAHLTARPSACLFISISRYFRPDFSGPLPRNLLLQQHPMAIGTGRRFSAPTHCQDSCRGAGCRARCAMLPNGTGAKAVVVRAAAAVAQSHPSCQLVAPFCLWQPTARRSGNDNNVQRTGAGNFSRRCQRQQLARKSRRLSAEWLAAGRLHNNNNTAATSPNSIHPTGIRSDGLAHCDINTGPADAWAQVRRASCARCINGRALALAQRARGQLRRQVRAARSGRVFNASRSRSIARACSWCVVASNRTIIYLMPSQSASAAPNCYLLL